MKTYTIDYCNGFTATTTADSLQDAQQDALDGAGLTGAHIKIYDGEGVLQAVARWFGYAADPLDKPLLAFGKSGFYTEWEGQTL